MSKISRIILDEDTRDFLEWREGSGNTVEIFDLVVNSNRRVGRGRRLVNRLIDEVIPPSVKLVWAITRADNFIAQAFYEELKFRVVAPLRNFYGQKTEDGTETVDAIMYGRDIGALV